MSIISVSIGSVRLSNILIAYATRRGWTAKTVEILARELKNSHSVDVVDLKKSGNIDLSKYDVVLVGSSFALGSWLGEVDEFLAKDLSGKKVGLFASAGSTMKGARGNPDLYASSMKKVIDSKAEKYGITPFTKKLFGGKISMFGISPLDSWSAEDPVEWAAEINKLLED